MERLRGWIQQATGSAARGIARFEAWPRPAQLLLTVAAVIGLSVAIDAANGWRVWNQLFHPDISTTADVRFWSALIYSLGFGLGLPVAFLLWHWRDRNVRDQIEEQRKAVENSRKDINLKEFQEVQASAAGLFDDKMPESARQQLQIASLHQLRAFLRGEYGESFRRPALELLLAGHAEAMDRIGTRSVRDQIMAADPKLTPGALNQVESALRGSFAPVIQERIGIIRDEASSIFTSKFPLNGRNFDFCFLQSFVFPEEIGLSGSSFLFAVLAYVHLKGADLSFSHLEGANLRFSHLEGANLSFAHLEGANLSFAHLEGAVLRVAHLEGADLRGAHLEGADLSGAHLEGANLSGAHLEGASLSDAHLEGADLRGAHLEGADLGGAHLEGASLESARFDDRTRLLLPWDEHSADNIKAAQGRLRALGARHIDDP